MRLVALMATIVALNATASISICLEGGKRVIRSSCPPGTKTLVVYDFGPEPSFIMPRQPGTSRAARVMDACTSDSECPRWAKCSKREGQDRGVCWMK